MADTGRRPQANTRSTSRLAVLIVAGSLLLGLAAGTVSYLGSSLVIGPEVRAGTDELRERGARRYFESCAGFHEPRFWPECSGDARENRARGADALVAFCTGADRGNRFFGPNDCLSEDRPAFMLSAGPGVEETRVGAIAAASALVALALVALLTRLRGYGFGGPRSAPIRE